VVILDNLCFQRGCLVCWPSVKDYSFVIASIVESY